MASSQTQSPKDHGLLGLATDACAQGDLEALKTHVSFKEGQRTFEVDKSKPVTSKSHPAWPLFEAAIRTQQPTIFTYLLETFPSFDITYHCPVIFQTKNIDLIKPMLDRFPEMADYEENYLTKLCEFCQGREKTDSDLVMLLLDAGADPEGGPFVNRPLDAAAGNSMMPEEVLRKLLEKGAKVRDSTLKVAESEGRSDAVKMLKEVKKRQDGGGKCTIM